MPDLIRGSEGHQFQIGNTRIYAGPRSERRGQPILAVRRPEDKHDYIVATFPNSSSAERFIAALIDGIEEATPIPIRAAAPDLDAEQQATVERFGLDTPPRNEEMLERIQLLAGEHGVKVEAA